MKNPTKFKVNFLTYDIEYIDSEIEEEMEIYGKCLYSENKIQLSKDLSIEYMKKTLVHECLHAIFEMYGINQNENKIDLLSTCIVEFIKLNPEIIEWILNKGNQIEKWISR